MTYPAIIVDENGDQTAGNTIEFTDPDNQPAGTNQPFKPAAGEAVTIVEDAAGDDALVYDDDAGGFFATGSFDVSGALTAEGNVLLANAGQSAQVGRDSTSTVGFYGTSPVARPVVPLTTPLPQDIIDALVTLGLVTQSD